MVCTLLGILACHNLITYISRCPKQLLFIGSIVWQHLSNEKPFPLISISENQLAFVVLIFVLFFVPDWGSNSGRICVADRI